MGKSGDGGGGGRAQNLFEATHQEKNKNCGTINLKSFPFPAIKLQFKKNLTKIVLTGNGTY